LLHETFCTTVCLFARHTENRRRPVPIYEDARDWGYNLVLKTWEEEVQYMVTQEDLQKMAILQQVLKGEPAPGAGEDDMEGDVDE